MATRPQNDMLCGDSDQQSSCLPVICNDGGDQSQGTAEALVVTGNNTNQHSDPNDAIKETEDFLAAEMNKLSVQERQKALDDVHCVGEELQETPEMVEKLLADFDDVVQATPNPTYQMAFNQNRSYVEDPSFRLRFLRAYLNEDIGRSVLQMMDFLEQKAKYFGNEKVAQEITLGDLSAAEKELMISSLFHIQASTDRNGRTMFYLLKFSRCEVESLIRVIYYVVFNILLPTPGVQTKGCVLVAYDTRQEGEGLTSFIPDFRFSARAYRYASCLPIRYSAVHLCQKQRDGDLALSRIFLDILKRGIPEHSRSRVRIHSASDMELRYILRGYGIPLESFPVDINGNLRSDIINTWFYKHLQGFQERLEAGRQEAKQEEEGGNQHPALRGISPDDVLLGRGRLVQYHPGNVRFREFLENHADDYDNTPRNTRSRVSADWTRELLASGVRFLKNEGDEWVECNFEEVVHKVSQFFRTRRRSKKEV